MKKKTFGGAVALLCAVGFTLPSGVHANNYTVGTQLSQLEPELSLKEVVSSIKDYAQLAKISDKKAENIIVNELSSKIQQEKEESLGVTGGSAGKYTLSKAKNIGDVFYTSSSSFGIPHGHVGIYNKLDRIVESISKVGVHTLAYNGRKVEKNAVMQYVNTKQNIRTAAANWAASRSGKDGYSYNFATNRSTGYTGAKNCSKLVWSAYEVKGSIDIDKDKGLGVYPVDIRDSGYTHTYKTIK